MKGSLYRHKLILFDQISVQKMSIKYKIICNNAIKLVLFSKIGRKS